MTAEKAGRLTLAVVIPTKDAGAELENLLRQLSTEALDIDVVVSAAVESVGDADIAARHGARITTAEGGRGPQMRAGADVSIGDWILFLHADSILPPDWDEIVARFAADPANARRAGYFRFRLDDRSPPARRLERMVAWRCRILGLPYGDQGLLVARDFLVELGGVPELPLMEDVALVRRIGKTRMAELGVPLTTSAEKFRRDGYLLRSARNLFCLTLYFLGLPPAAIRRLYG